MYTYWIAVLMSLFLNEKAFAEPKDDGNTKQQMTSTEKILILNPRCSFLQGSPNGAIHMRILSAQEDVLLEATLPPFFAKTVELHTHEDVGGVLKMRKVACLEIPKDGLDLRPGGDHIMLIGVGDDFKKGATLPLRLHFQKAGWIEVSIPVSAPRWRRESSGDVCRRCTH